MKRVNMSLPTSILALVLVAGITACQSEPGPSAPTDADPSWTLQERTLPAPAAASEVLRVSIAEAPLLY